MQHEAVVKATQEWERAIEEYMASHAKALIPFDDEQRAQLRKALEVLIQETPELGVFDRNRLRASVQAAVLRLNRDSKTMAEWLQEAVRHHVHLVVKIRNEIRKRVPVSKPLEPLPVPDPREVLDTKEDLRPTVPVPPPDPRNTSPSMEEEADDFEAGIDEIRADDESENEPPPIVIDVD